jgi:hypothetical protein
MREVRALNRAGRINQIILCFEIAISRGLGNEMSAYDIAEKIGMRAQSPAFREHLKAAVDDGVLTCREVQTGRKAVNGGVKFMFALKNVIAPKKREVAIKANGKQVGQLELF